MTDSSRVLTARDLAASTPAHRDRYVDLLRAASIVVVVGGHWLMAAVGHGSDGGLRATNLLDEVSWTRWLTWAFQVMPVFFLVGGFSNAASWEAARRDGRGYGEWLSARLRRIAGPLVVFATAWLVGGSVIMRLPLDGELLDLGGRVVALPLWFLAVYLAVVAFTPLALAAHRRWGLAVPAALGASALLVDVLHWNLGLPAIGWSNFALVWLLPHQLGFAWRDGRWTRARGLLLAGAGLATLVVLTRYGGYPLSMVGGPGDGRTNNTPPSFALVALAVMQTGLVVLARPLAERWLRRRLVWTVVVAANGLAMTLYLWHLTAMAAVTAGLLAPGVWRITHSPGTAAWWATRPVWVAALLAVLGPLVLLFSRFERSAGGRAAGTSFARFTGRLDIGPPSGPRAAAATLVMAAGCSWLALVGFGTGGRSTVGAVALVVAGALGLRGTRPKAARAAAATVSSGARTDLAT